MPHFRNKRTNREIPIDQLTYLNQNRIYWQEFKSKRSFICQACGLTFPSVGACIHHSNLQSHQTNLLTYQVRFVLLHLPRITEAHRLVLNQTLQSALEGVLIGADELDRRLSFADQIMCALRARVKNLQINGIGSLWDGLAVLDSITEFDICRIDSAIGSSKVSREAKQRPVTLVVSNDSYVQPPGLGYLLAEVFDVLKVNATDVVSSTPIKSQPDSSPVEPTSDSAHLSKFPAYSDVYTIEIENFYIMFTDNQGVRCRITTDFPRGHHLARLIHTYLDLDTRALNLAILFRKFSKLAYLDMSQYGTFQCSVLPLLVIFYLQHTSPPVLPNLHQLYRLHRTELPQDAFCQVIYDDGDYSFLTGSEYVAKYFPESQTNGDCFDLTDLWLGFLRFYLFDFQKSTFAVSIVDTEPVRWKRGRNGISSVVVLDPFDPERNLCGNIASSGFEYITSQLMAAYGYFGVPRLINGRHVFTNIQLHESPESSTKSVSPSAMCTDNKISHLQPTKANQDSRSIRLTPVIDDTDEFASNLVKLQSLLAENFAAVCRSEERDLCVIDFETDKPVSSTTTSTPLVAFRSMVPRIIQVILDEVLESDDILAVTEMCIAKNPRILYGRVYPEDLQVSQAQCQRFTKSLAKCFWSFLCRQYINRGLLTVKLNQFCRYFTVAFRAEFLDWYASSTANNDRGMAASSGVSSVSSLKVSNGDAPKRSDSVVGVTTNERFDDSLNTEAMDDELDNELESSFNVSEGSGEPIDQSMDYRNECSVDDHCESTERTLDLGDEDDVEMEGHGTSVEQDPDIDVAEESFKLEPSSQLPQESCTVADQGHKDSSSIITNLSCSPVKAIVRNKQRSSAKQKDVSPAQLTWNDVISSRDCVSSPIDDERMGYYHSAVVNSLQPEHLAFPFVAKGHLPPLGRSGIRSSVLGLAALNQPSTLLAHFERPEPQCRACGQSGHRKDMCVVSADQTVSFRAWQTLRGSVPSDVSPQQMEALCECLQRLASFHDCSHQEPRKHLLVESLRRVFSARFTSVRLEIFGSCANGFELPSSDMDLCVFFPPNSPRWNDLKTTEGTMKLIRQFKGHLERYSSEMAVTHIRAILNAKVPILKVRFSSGFEVDISFSNYLAVHNTRMLKLYTMIEPQLRTLGIALKIIGKLCHIGNASVGGVSSYAFVLMLIHYLQQKDHLPVLQQLYDGPEKPVHLVGGWNAWFQEDISIVRRLWQPPENRMSLAEMWLGFFRYYLFEFDREMNVVCIRQKNLLPRFVKMWSSLLAIEDPFNLDHNLTGALSRDSLLCILDVFYAVLLHHTTFVRTNLPLGEWQYSLFSPSSLSKLRRLGPPPKSRCFCCQQCGHRSADCPLKDKRAAGCIIPSHDSDIDVLIGPFLKPPALLSPPAQMMDKQPFPVDLHDVNWVPYQCGMSPYFLKPVSPVSVQNRHLRRYARPQYNRPYHDPQSSYSQYFYPETYYQYNRLEYVPVHPPPTYLQPQMRPPLDIVQSSGVQQPKWLENPGMYGQHFPPPSPGKPASTQKTNAASVSRMENDWVRDVRNRPAAAADLVESAQNLSVSASHGRLTPSYMNDTPPRIQGGHPSRNTGDHHSVHQIPRTFSHPKRGSRGHIRTSFTRNSLRQNAPRDYFDSDLASQMQQLNAGGGT